MSKDEPNASDIQPSCPNSYAMFLETNILATLGYLKRLSPVQIQLLLEYEQKEQRLVRSVINNVCLRSLDRG